MAYSDSILLACSRSIEDVAGLLQEPRLPNLLRRFLVDQLYGDDPDIVLDNIPPNDLPQIRGNIALHYSAAATYYAPSEDCGTGGMHRELIRSNPAWYGEFPRYDTVLVQNDEPDAPMGEMLVGRVKAFLAFSHETIRYPCALVEWFIPQGNAPDPLTGMWIVKPELRGGAKTIAIVHLDCITRACHLMPVFGRATVPNDFRFSDSLDAFRAFYVNHYIDYHSHECIPRV